MSVSSCGQLAAWRLGILGILRILRILRILGVLGDLVGEIQYVPPLWVRSTFGACEDVRL